jgi:hypothetical protein
MGRQMCRLFIANPGRETVLARLSEPPHRRFDPRGRLPLSEDDFRKSAPLFPVQI